MAVHRILFFFRPCREKRNKNKIKKKRFPPSVRPATTLATMPSDSDLQQLRAAIRDVPDFPKPGIVFKDITPVLSDSKLFQMAIDAFCEATKATGAQKVVGIDARGFLFGAAVAYRLGLGFVPVRKKGK